MVHSHSPTRPALVQPGCCPKDPGSMLSQTQGQSLPACGCGCVRKKVPRIGHAALFAPLLCETHALSHLQSLVALLTPWDGVQHCRCG